MVCPCRHVRSIMWVKQDVVSLMFRELSKIILRKYTMPVITFMVIISSWNFVRVPNAWLWAHEQSFSLKCSYEVRFLQTHKFRENILESSRNVSETTPQRLQFGKMQQPHMIDLARASLILPTTLLFSQLIAHYIPRIMHMVCVLSCCVVGCNMYFSYRQTSNIRRT